MALIINLTVITLRLKRSSMQKIKQFQGLTPFLTARCKTLITESHNTQGNKFFYNNNY